MTGENPREIAVEVLQRRSAKAYVEELFEAACARAKLSPPDRHLCQEIVYGVARWQGTLDWLIARKTQGRQQKPMLQNLLRMGLYQIFWLSRIPPHAAVNESVEIARRRGFGPQSGFVNAVLRGYLRERDATIVLLNALQKNEPHLGLSHPEWLYRRWERRWSTKDAIKFLSWNNAPPPVFARLNALKATSAELVMQWVNEKVHYENLSKPWFLENQVFELKSHPPLQNLASFQEGKFYVQDPSTLLAVQALDPQPGETILDLCAAPGGKLSFIAERMKNVGRIVAHDPATERLKLVGENMTRLGITIAEITSALPAEVAKFDRILIDAPCSNTGVMRRRIDLRWRIREEEISRLSEIQAGLLRQSVPLLKPGGRLVYSTCSLEPEENRQVVDGFLAGTKNLRLESESELWPFRDLTDGAYVAVLISA